MEQQKETNYTKYEVKRYQQAFKDGESNQTIIRESNTNTVTHILDIPSKLFIDYIGEKIFVLHHYTTLPSMIPVSIISMLTQIPNIE